jgi:hypothetical protein
MDELYNPEITDLEADEYHGNPRPVVYLDEAKALCDKQSRGARIDEILQIRAVGDRIAAQRGASFEELSGAYDAHILKRAADLTEAGASSEDTHEE